MFINGIKETKNVVAAGATSFESPSEVDAQCDVVFMCRKDTAAVEIACLDQVEFQRARTLLGSLSIRRPYHPMLRRKWQRGFAAKRNGIFGRSLF